nr:MAG TPA: hypothetical protein [Caudoviricetes sp.]
MTINTQKKNGNNPFFFYKILLVRWLLLFNNIKSI